MSVALAPVSPASTPSPVESAGSAALDPVPADSAGGAFPRLLDAAKAAPAAAVPAPEARPDDAAIEAGNAVQASDPTSVFGVVPVLSAGLPLPPSVDARSGSPTPEADAALLASITALPASVGAPAAVSIAGRPTPRSGAADGPVADSASVAAMTAELPAARTAAGGARLPESSTGSAASLRVESSSGGPDGRGAAEPGSARLGPSPTALVPASGIESGMAPPGAVGSSTGSSVVTTVVGTPVGRAEWGSAVGERIGWLASQRVQVAELQLSPAHLGPVEVRITLDRDVATIALAAAHAPVRDALQASLPRLVEALAGSGLQLGQASVGAESFLGGHAQDRGAGRGSQESSPSLLSPATTEIPSRAMRMQPLASAMARGGIDLFA